MQVDPANEAPVARANVRDFWKITILSAFGSEDPDGRITEYEWQLPGGKTVKGWFDIVRIEDEGPVTLTVTDDDGATDTDQTMVRR